MVLNCLLFQSRQITALISRADNPHHKTFVPTWFERAPPLNLTLNSPKYRFTVNSIIKSATIYHSQQSSQHCEWEVWELLLPTIYIHFKKCIRNTSIELIQDLTFLLDIQSKGKLCPIMKMDFEFISITKLMTNTLIICSKPLFWKLAFMTKSLFLQNLCFRTPKLKFKS